MINRAAVILKYTQEAVDWINRADPCYDDPGMTVEGVNKDRTVYLISDEDAEDQDAVERWISDNYLELFERELGSWYTAVDSWPNDRSREVFNR